MHACIFFICCRNCRHITEVKLRIYTLRIHIQCQRHNIHISGTLAISEQSAFNTISTCQKSHFCITDTTSTVIMRMQRDQHILTIFHVFAHIFNLACVNVRHCILYSTWQVYDAFVICGRLPYIQNCVAYFQCIFRFCSGKALRTVLKCKISFCLISQLFQKFGTVYGNLQDLFFGFFKYLFSLCHRGRIVYMYNRSRSTFHCFKSLADNMLSCLCQYLNGHIIRNQVLIDQCSQEIILCLGSGRETDFDFFKTNLYKQFKEFYLLFQTHRYDQCLVSITQIDAAPDWCLIYISLFHPVIAFYWRHKILSLIFTYIFHHFNRSPFLFVFDLSGRHRLKNIKKPYVSL